jgi:hypothetical protein
VRAAGLPDLLHRISGGIVESLRSSERLCARELFIRYVHCCHFGPELASDLHGEMAQSSETKNRESLPGRDFRLFERAIHRYSGAKERRCFG